MEVYLEVVQMGRYNLQGARRRVQSGLNVKALARHLEGYGDSRLLNFLMYDWLVYYCFIFHCKCHDVFGWNIFLKWSQSLSTEYSMELITAQFVWPQQIEHMHC